MHCANCGRQVSETDSFCSGCGKRLTTTFTYDPAGLNMPPNLRELAHQINRQAELFAKVMADYENFKQTIPFAGRSNWLTSLNDAFGTPFSEDRAQQLGNLNSKEELVVSMLSDYFGRVKVFLDHIKQVNPARYTELKHSVQKILDKGEPKLAVGAVNGIIQAEALMY